MASNSLKEIVEGTLANAVTDSADQADHMATRHFVLPYNTITEESHVFLVAVAQADITITAAYLVPSITLANHATNIAVLTLQKDDLAASGATAFDAWSTVTGGDGALTQAVQASLTIDPSTDTLTKGEGLFLKVDTTGGTGPAVSGTLVVEYELTN